MNCLVVAATVLEISPFLDQYKKQDNLPNIETDILITGIGLTATAYSLTTQLHIKRPDIIIQAGIGGCYDKNISLGTVMVIQQDVIADQGVIESNKLKTIFDLRLIQPNQFPYSKGWLVNTNEVVKKTKLKKVKAISVNQITSSKKMIVYYREKFEPVTESMEGAALHYVCLLEKIPFLQLRSVSNYIGERDKKKWNIKESITNLNKELIKTVESINNNFKP